MASVALPFKRMDQVGSLATTSLKVYQTPPLRSAKRQAKRKRFSKPSSMAANFSSRTPPTVSMLSVVSSRLTGLVENHC